MKKLLVIAILFFFNLILYAQVSAESTTTSPVKSSPEDNYLAGLNSDNQGLQISATYFLGNMKSQKAVIPLMKIFRDENNPMGLRLMAAWSLTKIGDERGMYLIKCASEQSSCDYLKCLSEYFYREHCLQLGHRELY